jgi:glycine oxidase
VALTESEEEVLHDKVRWLSQQGHPVRWLDRSEVLSREPALTPGLRGAFLDEDAYQIHPARFTQALGSAAARAGARFRLGLDVTGVATERQRVTRILTSEGAIAANHLVLATGAWLRVAGSWLGVTLPVAPVKGQILTVTAVPSPVDAIIFGAEIYLLPRTEGQIVVGATAERAGFDKSLTADALAWLLGTIPTLCPSLRGARFERAWAGLRPGSPDELPIVGPAPGWENVTVAGGHFRNGIMLTPITARLVADLILRNTSDALLAPLSPARFGTATS